MIESSASARNISNGDSTVHFSPERALEAIDDRWGLLVLQRAIFQNASQFDDFRSIVGITEDVLDARLTALTGAGLLQREPGVGEGHSPSFHLTVRGRSIEPVILALSSWRDSWTTTSPASPAAAPSVAPSAATFSAVVDSRAPIQLASESPIRNVTPIRPDVQQVKTRSGPGPLSASQSRAQIEINLLGGFSMRIGGENLFSVSTSSQRLIGFLGVHSGSVPRTVMAARLWPDASEVNAGVSLRSALSRLDSASRTAVLSSPVGLSLQPAVSVDFREARSLASRLAQTPDSDNAGDLDGAATTLLSADIFPDLFEEWAVSEADDWRHRRVNALETQSERLLEIHRLADAAVAARAAIRAEPLRESPYAILIRTHLAAGNQSQALKVFDAYSTLLSADLQLEPTVLLTRLVADIRR